jgi:hypothetical protein
MISGGNTYTHTPHFPCFDSTEGSYNMHALLTSAFLKYLLFQTASKWKILFCPQRCSILTLKRVRINSNNGSY